MGFIATLYSTDLFFVYLTKLFQQYKLFNVIVYESWNVNNEDSSCHLRNIYLVGLRNTTKDFSFSSLFYDRDLNPELTENGAGMPTTLLRPLVCRLTNAGGRYGNISAATVLLRFPYGSTDSTNVCWQSYYLESPVANQWPAEPTLGTPHYS
jgi:hypothetical protein